MVLPTDDAVDLQAWFDLDGHAGWARNGGSLFPDGDVNQAYTAQFGGSSGASAMVAGISAVVSGVSQSRWERFNFSHSTQRELGGLWIRCRVQYAFCDWSTARSSAIFMAVFTPLNRRVGL